MKTRPLVLVVLAAAVVLVGLAAVALLRPTRPSVEPPAPVAAGGPVVGETGQIAPDLPPVNTKAPVKPPAPVVSREEEPLPPLVPGNPLNDNRFAALSAQIVIASVGLKKDAQWEALVLEYMTQALAKEGLTAEQYQEYAQALYHHPDRGRAVSENIMRRVEKKLGTRVSMDALPLFKTDPNQLKKLQRKLQE